MSKSSYKNHINELKKNEIEKMISSFSFFCDKKEKSYRSIKKDKLLELLNNNLNDYIHDLLLWFSKEEYSALKKLLKQSPIKKSSLNYNELMVVSIFDKFSFFIEKKIKNRVYYEFYPDVKKKIEKHINKEILSYIKTYEKKYAFINGVVNAHGRVSFDKLFEIYQLAYNNDTKEEVKNIINKRMMISTNYKVQENKKEGIVLYNKQFSTFTEASKIKLPKELPVYMCDEYIAFGLKTYKYNKSFKKLIHFIKRKYVFKKKDLDIFNQSVLNKFVDMYHIDKKVAKEFLKKEVKEKFEFKSDKLEKELIDKAVSVAESEPKWEV